MKKTYFSSERPPFEVFFKGIRTSAENDGKCVAFYHSSTGALMALVLVIPMLIHSEMMLNDQCLLQS